MSAITVSSDPTIITEVVTTSEITSTPIVSDFHIPGNQVRSHTTDTLSYTMYIPYSTEITPTSENTPTPARFECKVLCRLICFKNTKYTHQE